MQQHTSTIRGRSTKICTTPQLPSCKEKCNGSTLTAHMRADFILILRPTIIILSFAQQIILIVASWLFSHGEKPSGPRIIRKLSSSTRERTQSEEKEQAEDSSHPKVIEVLLRETARKSYPDNVDNPMIAPQDDEVRQSGRVLELQNKDLWIRRTDLTWHFPILVTTRELPFKNYRRRSLAKLEARDEAKKHKTLKNRKEEWDSARWKQSSWTCTTSSSSSAWREWSPDEARERSDWQSADWEGSDQTRKDTTWQSHVSWQ